jgi:hypothetical protein
MDDMDKMDGMDAPSFRPTGNDRGLAIAYPIDGEAAGGRSSTPPSISSMASISSIPLEPPRLSGYLLGQE